MFCKPLGHQVASEKCFKCNRIKEDSLPAILSRAKWSTNATSPAPLLRHLWQKKKRGNRTNTLHAVLTVCDCGAGWEIVGPLSSLTWGPLGCCKRAHCETSRSGNSSGEWMTSGLGTERTEVVPWQKLRGHSWHWKRYWCLLERRKTSQGIEKPEGGPEMTKQKEETSTLCCFQW